MAITIIIVVLLLIGGFVFLGVQRSKKSTRDPGSEGERRTKS